MSKVVDQAKKEAKRLLRYARAHGLACPEGFSLSLSSLAQAQQCVANLKGFPDWHALATFEREASACAAEHEAALHSKIIASLTDSALGGCAPLPGSDPRFAIVDTSVLPGGSQALLRMIESEKLRRESIKGCVVGWDSKKSKAIDAILVQRLSAPLAAPVRHACAPSERHWRLGSFIQKSRLKIGRKHHEFTLDASMLRRHLFLYGASGSGARSFAINLAAQQIESGHPAVFIDCSGNPSVSRKIAAVTAKAGCHEALRTLDFSGATSTSSFSVDPFANFDARLLVELLSPLHLPASSHDDVWVARYRNALAIIGSIIEDLIVSTPQIVVDLPLVRGFLHLETLMLVREAHWLTDKTKTALHGFLSSVPGVCLSAGTINALALDLFSYLSMQATPLLEIIEHLYCSGCFSVTPNFDFNEILSGAHLVCMLPNPEKTGDDSQWVMRYVSTCIHRLIDRRLSCNPDALTTHLCPAVFFDGPPPQWLDHKGGMPGVTLASVQARAAGFSLIYRPAYFGGDMDSVLANTSTKVFFRAFEPEVFSCLAATAGLDAAAKFPLMHLDTGEAVICTANNPPQRVQVVHAPIPALGPVPEFKRDALAKMIGSIKLHDLCQEPEIQGKKISLTKS